jgi:hypothetical protein
LNTAEASRRVQGDAVGELDLGFRLSGIQGRVHSKQKNDFFTPPNDPGHIGVNTAHIRVVPDDSFLSIRLGCAFRSFIFFKNPFCLSYNSTNYVKLAHKSA